MGPKHSSDRCSDTGFPRDISRWMTHHDDLSERLNYRENRRYFFSVIQSTRPTTIGVEVGKRSIGVLKSGMSVNTKKSTSLRPYQKNTSLGSNTRSTYRWSYSEKVTSLVLKISKKTCHEAPPDNVNLSR